MTTVIEELDEKVLDLSLLARKFADLPGTENKERALMLVGRRDALLLQKFQDIAVRKYLNGKPLTSDQEHKALQTGIGPNGGYLVGAPTYQEYLSQAQPPSPVYDLVTHRDLLKGDGYPVAKNREAFQVVRRKETDAHIVTSDLGMGLDRIPVHDLVCTPKVSQQFLDALGSPVEDWLLPEVLNADRTQEAKEILIGSGVGECEGIVVCSGVTSVNSGDASTVTTNGINALFYGVPEPFRSSGYWIMSRATAQVVKQLKDDSNMPIYQQGQFGVSPDVMHGRPVLVDDNMPDIAAGSFPIVFGDLKFYYLVIRIALSVLRDPFTEKGFVIFDCVRRSGGQVVRPEAFAKQKIAA